MTTLWTPTLRLDVLQVTVFELAVPVGRATALQPVSVAPSAVKATVPVGALPVTVAANVTFEFKADGLAELARLAVLAVLLATTCDNAALLELPLAESPP